MQRANRAWLRLSIALPGSLMKGQDNLYRGAGVDIAAAESGLKKIVDSIRQTWPAADGVGAVKLDIGYFANVIDIGGVGLAICTDGGRAKSIRGDKTQKYNTKRIGFAA